MRSSSPPILTQHTSQNPPSSHKPSPLLSAHACHYPSYVIPPHKSHPSERANPRFPSWTRLFGPQRISACDIYLRQRFLRGGLSDKANDTDLHGMACEIRVSKLHSRRGAHVSRIRRARPINHASCAGGSDGEPYSSAAKDLPRRHAFPSLRTLVLACMLRMRDPGTVIASPVFSGRLDWDVLGCWAGAGVRHVRCGYALRCCAMT
jgi:hypothetical protein